MSGRVDFIGLAYDPLDVDGAVGAITGKAQANEAFAYVVTPNVDHIVRLSNEPELKPLYDDAWLTLCDSRILELLAKQDRLALPAAPGSDITEKLFATRIRPETTITVIGGTLAVIDALKARYALRDVRWFNAPQGLRTEAGGRASCVEFIAANPAPYVFLAVGSPQQEMIAREALQSGRCVGVGLCCGASLDFLAGAQHRAPKWMRASRLEWLHRLATSPFRLGRRYLVEGPRIFGLWLKHRRPPSP